MPDIYIKKHLEVWAPATYRIEVEGFLEEGLSDLLGGFRIDTYLRNDQTKVAVISGRARDQAELVGILNTLYEMHLPILSVEKLCEDDDSHVENE